MNKPPMPSPHSPVHPFTRPARANTYATRAEARPARPSDRLTHNNTRPNWTNEERDAAEWATIAGAERSARSEARKQDAWAEMGIYNKIEE